MNPKKNISNTIPQFHNLLSKARFFNVTNQKKTKRRHRWKMKSSTSRIAFTTTPRKNFICESKWLKALDVCRKTSSILFKVFSFLRKSETFWDGTGVYRFFHTFFWHSPVTANKHHKLEIAKTLEKHDLHLFCSKFPIWTHSSVKSSKKRWQFSKEDRGV